MIGLHDTGDLANIVGAAAAVVGVSGVLGGLARRRRSWWRPMALFWTARQDTGTAGRYPLDAHVPSLLAVYVPRRAVPGSGTPDRPVPTDDLVLTGTGHVLLVGPPGGGKTALVDQAESASARRWLTSRGRLRRAPAGPVVVAIAAADLVGQPLLHAVAAACAPWVPERDRDPLARRRLVILVDGLDAVVDANARSDVINKLAHEAELLRRWRLVVTTRLLTAREVRTLHPFAVHHLVPFTRDDVTALAAAWFRTGREGVSTFVAWLEGQRLGDSARSPLLTTVAAVLWESDGPVEGRAPDPAALLDRFIDLLLGARRHDLDEILGASEPLASWVTGHLRDLLEVAADASLSGADVASATAAWARSRAPGELPSGLVSRILRCTGLFRAERDALVPAWPSLIDFLAAGPGSREPDLRTLSTAVRDPSRRAVATWTIGRAGKPEDLVGAILAGPSGPVDLAAAIAGGLAVPGRVRTQVLVALLRDESPAAATTLAGLASDPDTVSRLREIARDEHQSRGVRQAAQRFFAERAVA